MVRSRRKENKVFDQSPDLKSSEKAIEKLTQARISLLLNHPFFGNMVSRFEMIESSEWLQTAATDGLNFYFNSEFVNKLDQKEVEFLFGHEVLHCCYEHIFRTDNRDKMIFNIACDYCVNRDLVHNNIGRKTTTVKCLFDKKFDDMSAEDVYEDLKKNNTPKDLNILSQSILDVHLDYSSDS
jgi:predicted metal-dependent peptidase